MLIGRQVIKKILLIEDEIHKRDELTACLHDFFKGQIDLQCVDSVNSAYQAVSTEIFDLIVLDMALPTFSAAGRSAERGYDQELGGVEVLRTLKNRGVTARIVIITQYPEVTVGGKRVKLSKAPSILSLRYSQNIVGGVLYKYRSPSNNLKLTALLKNMI